MFERAVGVGFFVTRLKQLHALEKHKTTHHCLAKSIKGQIDFYVYL